VILNETRADLSYGGDAEAFSRDGGDALLRLRF
jgi:hypothetical protein